MRQRVESPFKGKPKTRQKIDRKGNLKLTVTIRELTPWRARLRDNASVAGALGVFVANLYAISLQPAATGIHWIIALTIPFAAYFLLKLIIGGLLKKCKRVRFTEDHVMIKRLIGWRRFDRSISKFALIKHDRADREAEDHAYEMRKAQMRGKVIRKVRYEGVSQHLCLAYAGQRRDIMAIYGLKLGDRALTRLQACDAVMDAVSNGGGGTPLSVDYEWGETPGDIDPHA